MDPDPLIFDPKRELYKNYRFLDLYFLINPPKVLIIPVLLVREIYAELQLTLLLFQNATICAYIFLGSGDNVL